MRSSGSTAISESRFLRNRHNSADPSDGLLDAVESRRDTAADVVSPPTSLDTCVTLSSNDNDTPLPFLSETRDAGHEKKEGTTFDEAAEIDAVVGCLTSTGRCFVNETQKTVRCCRIALVLILCTALTLYVFQSRQSKHDTSAMTFDPQKVLYIGRSRPQLPVVAVISTHHRSGTVLFLSVTESWCEAFRMDYERLELPFLLPDPLKKAAEDSERSYGHFYGAKEKLVIGMHGFVEQCQFPRENDESCALFDSKCWLTSCYLTTDPKKDEFPVVHVVRNPVEVLISAYLYHQKENPVPEGWLRQPKPDALHLLPVDVQKEMQSVPYYQVLQRLPPDQGLRVEYAVEMEDLFRMARNYRDLAKLDRALNIKYEDILQDFEGVMRHVAQHLTLTERFLEEKIMNIALLHNIQNMSLSFRKRYSVDMHVTEGTHDKASLRKVLYSDREMRGVMQAIAKSLDYPNPFSLPPSQNASIAV